MTPDVAAPIRAYRSWKVDRRGRLLSAFQDYVWNREVAADCIYGMPPAAARCVCGLYACKTLADVVEVAPVLCAPNHVAVYGAVDLWGRVNDYASGYRAQYARVIELYATTRAATRAATRIEVPIQRPPPELLHVLATNATCSVCRRRAKRPRRFMLTERTTR